MNHIKKLLLATIFFLSVNSSFAWGVLGHRIVGEIADSYLSKHARKEIRSILGFESVAMASNWADFIKSDPNFKYLYNWHFSDIPGGLSHDAVMDFFAKDTITDAFNKINFIKNELKNNRQNLSQETKVLYLRMLIHIVGDIHQPLHVGRPEDQGGNKIKVLWFDDTVRLHQVWDEKLVNFQQLSYTEYATAINHTTKEQRAEWQKQPLTEWLYQSYQFAEKIYADAKPYQKFSYEYNFKFIAPLNESLLKGGVRLAGLLNEIFD